MSDKVVNNNYSIGFLPLLALIFITLKLTGVITWSWWLVLLPLYPVFIFLAVIFIPLLSILLFGLFRSFK